ncbi:MAG: Holliday junction resolvase RecU [Erysipelotrichaceae bacterium]
MINYPNRKQNTNNVTKIKSHSYRGANLEDDLNQTNQYYIDLNKANIHKKPTPIMVVKVDYPSRNKAKIVEAYYKIPSTTDYNGVYRSKAIDFEAKETNSQTALPLKNIHSHQIEHMRNVEFHGGLSFIIIRFVYYNETYLLYFKDLDRFIKSNDRKSIPYSWIKENAHIIPFSLTPPIHYLKVLDETYFTGEVK